ncbi:hypothetical protein EGK_09054 [Macaca mulatta]|uniref:Uncharacterized protein n=2 Tax=Macaca TaxID=9539 RepID=F6V6F8_MACMU|nr:hypothetical protein EGK_09054 [Macaca mulatta]EHH58398.1 hypothetical protein EGM_08238 [Macaca fascicularis]
MVIECAPWPGIQDGVTMSLVDNGEVARAFADGQPCPAATPLGLFLVCSLNNVKSEQPEEILPPFSQSWSAAPPSGNLLLESALCKQRAQSASGKIG